MLERELVKDTESPFALYASHMEMPQSFTSQVMRVRMSIDELPGTQVGNSYYGMNLTLRGKISYGTTLEKGYLWLQHKSHFLALQFDVYNLHLTGGSYGKPKGVLRQRREMRQGQLAALSKSCLKSSVKEVIIKEYI